ncbi:sucrose synthase [Quercus suber]|uniref:sucrose synthase n=1 Tax=Quercus suber TaxID=58331 RepID=A0AAW0M5E8_QUESU
MPLRRQKYPDSDINWKKFDDYHFSCQFSADLIAIDQTDFIITSTLPTFTSPILRRNKGCHPSTLKLKSFFSRLCVLKDQNKPIIFTMARLDRVKNITGLVEWYGKNTRLRELVNLVVVARDRRKEYKDLEEQAEMKKMYGLIETYNLNGQFRWISPQMNRVRNGELYRYIADTKGAFD